MPHDIQVCCLVLSKVVDNFVGMLYKPKRDNLVEVSAKSGIQLLLFRDRYERKELIHDPILFVFENDLVQVWNVSAETLCSHERQCEAPGWNVIEFWLFCHHADHFYHCVSVEAKG